MGMPKIECTHIDELSALTALLQSVALVESALAHILNAEGEKLQKAVCMAHCIEELIDVNESITETVNAAAALEASLRDKTVATLNELNELRQQCYKKD